MTLREEFNRQYKDLDKPDLEQYYYEYAMWLERKCLKLPSEFEMEELKEIIDVHERAVHRLLEKFCVDWHHLYMTRTWAYEKDKK